MSAQRYRFRFLTVNSSAVQFDLTDNDVAEPYPTLFGGQRLRPLDGRAESLAWTLRVSDYSEALSGRLDEKLADREVITQRSVGASTWETIARSRIAEINQVSSNPVQFDVRLSDERFVERGTDVFTGGGATVRVWPPDLLDSYGNFDPDTEDSGSPLGGPIYWTYTGRRGSADNIGIVSANRTPYLPESIRELMRGDLSAEANIWGVPYLNSGFITRGSFKRLRFRLLPYEPRFGGDTDTFTARDFQVLGFHESANNSIVTVAPLALAVGGPGATIPWVFLYDPTKQLPTDSIRRPGYFYMPNAPASDLLPIHVGGSSGVDAFQHVKDVYDGQYQADADEYGNALTPATVRYSTAYLGAYSTGNPKGLIGNPRYPRVRFRKTQPENMATHLERDIYGPFGVVPAIDAEGRIAPVSILPPDADSIASTTGLQELNAANSELLPTWQSPSRDRVTKISYRFKTEERGGGEIDPATNELEPGYGLDRIRTIEGSPAVRATTEPGPIRARTYDLAGLHAPSAVSAWADIHSAGVFSLYRHAPEYSTVVTQTTAGDALTPGDATVLNYPTYPNTVAGGRGDPALALVIGTAKRPIGAQLTLLNAGANLQPLPTPTVTLARTTSNPKHSIDATIANVSTGVDYALEMARTTAPTSTIPDNAYAPVGTGRGSETVTIASLRSGTRYAARAVARLEGRIGSLRSVADTTTTQTLSAPTSVVASNITDNRAEIRWKLGETDAYSQVLVAGTVRARLLPQGATYWEMSGTTGGLVQVRHVGPFGGLGTLSSGVVVSYTTSQAVLGPPRAIVVKIGEDSITKMTN
jgi:hypothetical protein